MFSNYLKIAFRNLQRQKLYAFLNIAGLAVGLAAGILILLWVVDEMTYDRFHTRLSNLHILLQDQTYEGETHTYFAMPGPLGPDLKREFPEITHAVRASFIGERLLRSGDQVFNEASFYAEPEFFDMFSFTAIMGDPKTAMTDPGSAVITERLAKKLFGFENPIGKPLNINNRFDYRVAAVLKDIPSNSTLQFDVVLPFSIFEKASASWITSYGTNSLSTWIETQPGVNMDALNGKLYNYIQSKYEGADGHLHAWPLSRWRLESEFKNGQPAGGRIRLVQLFLFIGIAVILVACINFMNLSTARSAGRAREVGVRKAIGALRSRIIFQFMSEAAVMVLIGLVLAVTIALGSLSGFNQLTGKTFTINSIPPVFWAGIAILGVITALVSGSYPALFLSRFDPVRALKGNAETGKTGAARWFRKTLVVVQFTFSVALIITTIIIRQQIEFARNIPLGYNKDNLIYLSSRGDMDATFPAFKQDVEALTGIKNVSAAADNLIEYGSNTSGIRWPGKPDDQEVLITVTYVGARFFETANIAIKEGRDFRTEENTDRYSVILNETAVKRMGLTSPIGQKIEYDTARTIVGVVSDFLFNNTLSAPEPMVIMFDPTGGNNYFIRLDNDANWQQHLSQVEQVFKKHFPQFLFDPHFVEAEFEEKFENMKLMSMLGNIFSGLAIFISCLGLFGLSAFTAEQRRKEVGIRKVLGASVAGITSLLAKDFLKPVLLAIGIATPIASWLIQKWLSDFEKHVDIHWWVFALAGIMAILIAFLTVSAQSVRAALGNPVEALKTE